MTTVNMGLVHVYTGDGKGKTTAAVGLAVRAVGAGLRVAFIQFIKGGTRSSELDVLEHIGVRVERPAVRSTGLLADGLTEADRTAAREAWSLAAEAIASFEYDLVILDEINVAIAHGLVSEADVLAALDERFPAMEVVLTGRGATEAICARANLVTEMVSRRHPYDEGIGARHGIEY